jgi:two-component system OmpR family response regulator
MLDMPTDQLLDAFRALLVGKRALLLEDDAELSAGIVHYLRGAGFAEIDCVMTGEEAVERALRRDYDVLILDRTTPSLDGVSALLEIRRRATRAIPPALFLTSLGSERNRIEGFASGGDDYLVKPISDEELLARVAALLRRHERTGGGRVAEAVEVGPLTVSPAALRATLGGVEIELTPREFSILALLAANAGLPVTRSMLWSRCWSTYTFQPSNFANTIDVHVSRLRRKLEAAGALAGIDAGDMIVAVRVQGIMLRAAG